MHDKNENKSKVNGNNNLGVAILQNGLQVIMSICLIIIAYKLIYRPLSFGVDILPYTLVDCSKILLGYGLCDCLYNFIALKYTDNTKAKGIQISTIIILIINLTLAFNVAPTIYYNIWYISVVFTYVIISTVITLYSSYIPNKAE